MNITNNIHSFNKLVRTNAFQRLKVLIVIVQYVIMVVLYTSIHFRYTGILKIHTYTIEIKKLMNLDDTSKMKINSNVRRFFCNLNPCNCCDISPKFDCHRI